MVQTNAYPQGRGAHGVAIGVTHEDKTEAGSRFRPTRIALFAQGNAASTYPSTKRLVTSQYSVAEVEGYGSPAHLMMKELEGVGLPITFYPLDLTGTASAGDVTPSITTLTQTGKYYVKVSNTLSDPFSVVVGDTVATIVTKMTTAVNAVSAMPIIASDDTTTMGTLQKWHGTSGDNTHLEIVSPSNPEATFAFTQPTGGAGTPDITAALAQIGNAWDTHVINALDYTDSAELAEFAAFGETRRAASVHKTLCVFTGVNEPTRATVTAVTDARSTDRTNVFIPVPGSRDLPCVIAAAAVRQIASRESRDPAYDYIGLACPTLTPGTDAQVWDDDEIEAAFDLGCSNTGVADGKVVLGDIITCYHPTGEEEPGFRHVVDFAKRSTAVYNLHQLISPLIGRPLIADVDASDNPNAIKPKSVKGMLGGMTDQLVKRSVLTDADYAKENTQVSIGTTNSKRLDVRYVAKLSGNANVISIDFASSFNYGV